VPLEGPIGGSTDIHSLTPALKKLFTIVEWLLRHKLLGVNSPTEALARAGVLGLLERAESPM
jgi:hypothetical protein